MILRGTEDVAVEDLKIGSLISLDSFNAAQMPGDIIHLWRMVQGKVGFVENIQYTGYVQFNKLCINITLHFPELGRKYTLDKTFNFEDDRFTWKIVSEP
jgi:hypothetical protein